MDKWPTFESIREAAQRLAHQAHRTPIATSRTLNELIGAEVYCKCENLQRAGAFKFRGAYNTMSQLSAEQRQRGVVSFSSGNHAQAVALVGKLLQTPTVIVMPRRCACHQAGCDARLWRGGGGVRSGGAEARGDREAAGR